MEILNQTNKYIEELGEKVSVQKQMIGTSRSGIKKNRNSIRKNEAGEGSDIDSDLESVKEVEEEAPDLANMDDNEAIKYNLKNSSNVYYKITHSVQEDVKC